jgi:hypothetical protein
MRYLCAVRKLPLLVDPLNLEDSGRIIGERSLPPVRGCSERLLPAEVQARRAPAVRSQVDDGTRVGESPPEGIVRRDRARQQGSEGSNPSKAPTPPAKHEAIAHLVAPHHLNMRQACTTVRYSREALGPSGLLPETDSGARTLYFFRLDGEADNGRPLQRARPKQCVFLLDLRMLNRSQVTSQYQ